MKVQDLHKGMKVRIGDDISLTHKRHTSGPSMKKMMGKVYEVSRVNVEGNRVHIGGYVWAPEDIRPIEVKEPEPQIFHFDINKM